MQCCCDGLATYVDVLQYKGADGRDLMKLDGPYGAASEEAFDFKIVMLIGAGKKEGVSKFLVPICACTSLTCKEFSTRNWSNSVCVYSEIALPQEANSREK